MILGRKTVKLVYPLIPLGLAATFLVDVAGPLDPYVSLMYIPIIVLAAKVFARAGVGYIALASIVLTVASFVVAKVNGFDNVTAPQLSIILLAIVTSSSFIMRLKRAKVFAQNALLDDDAH